MQETRPFVPAGYKFRPSDEELIEEYLSKKVAGIPIPCVEYIVKECDLYGKNEPREIWESNGGPLLKPDDDLYFFTQLKKKTPNSSRIDRRVGAGAWQGEDAPSEIVSSISQEVIGTKKRFRYEKEGSEENGCWIMHEYTLDQTLLGKNQSVNYVLCRIRKNEPTWKKNKSSIAKTRKLQDFQNNNQFLEAESFFGQQEKKQTFCLDNVERQLETGGTDSCDFAEVEAMMLQQDNESEKEPIRDSVDWVTMSCMKEMLCELTKLMSDEYVYVPCDDGDSARNTSSGVEVMTKGQNFSDHGDGGEGNLQRIGSVADVPMVVTVADVPVVFPDQTAESQIPELVPYENGVAPSASVDIGTMVSLSELEQLCELPPLPSEETVLAPIDGETARSTSVDWMQTLDELLNEPEDYGSTSSSLLLSLDDSQPFDPLLFGGENFGY